MVTITFFCVSPVTASVAAETISAIANETSTARASRRFFMSVLRVFGSTSCPVRPGRAARVPGGSALETKGDHELTGLFDLLASHAQRADGCEPAPELIPAISGNPQGEDGGTGNGLQHGGR